MALHSRNINSAEGISLVILVILNVLFKGGFVLNVRISESVLSFLYVFFGGESKINTKTIIYTLGKNFLLVILHPMVVLTKKMLFLQKVA